MQNNPKQIILQILEITGYQKDKDKYAIMFIDNIYKQVLVNILGNVSDSDRKEIQSKLIEVNEPEKAKDILSQYVSDEDYDKEIKQVSQKVFEEYLKAIMPTLTKEQAIRLQDYLTSLK